MNRQSCRSPPAFPSAAAYCPLVLVLLFLLSTVQNGLPLSALTVERPERAAGRCIVSQLAYCSGGGYRGTGRNSPNRELP